MMMSRSPLANCDPGSKPGYRLLRPIETASHAFPQTQRIIQVTIYYIFRYDPGPPIHIKQPILAADLAMTAASCGNFGGVQSAHDSIC